MEEKPKKKPLLTLIRAFLISLPVIVIADTVIAFVGFELRVRNFAVFAAAVLAFFILLGFILPEFFKKLMGSARLIYLTVILCAGACLALRFQGAYVKADTNGKTGVFSGRSVMLFVPHQDDDLNLLGGVMEEYLSYGSELRVVFTTNGDGAGKEIGEKRLREAIKVLGDIGVREENIIFLGYSDSMMTDEGYFFDYPYAHAHSQKGDSYYTYGLYEHPAYIEGRPYTRENMTEDIYSLILEYKPDTLICVDRDDHQDHIAASLIFEAAMGRVLKDVQDYRPLVLKGFAYGTAYYSENDFYDSLNILSSVTGTVEGHVCDNGRYIWDKRLRLPVSAGTLSRSMLGCSLWRSICDYEQTAAYLSAQSIINGDRVFWVRDTGSVLYDADIDAPQGDPSKLNDFVLGDSLSAQQAETVPCLPNTSIIVELSSPRDISLVRLYDAPSAEDNILKATIVFNNGGRYEVGALDKYGAATDIEVNEKNVSSFGIIIEETEGSPALSEIEAFEALPDTGLEFIKLTDRDGNFVYDYVADSGEAEFGLYTVGTDAVLNTENYLIVCSNNKCSAGIRNGSLFVSCPEGEETVVFISLADNETVSDSIFVRNDAKLTLFFKAAAKIECAAYRLISPLYRLTATGKLITAVMSKI